MAIRRDLIVRILNNPGALGRVCQAFADERVNVLALAVDPGGLMRAVVDNPVHAVGVLRERHYHVEERDVLFTAAPNNPGELARLTRLIADAGINIEYLYVTAVEGEAMAAIVVGVPDAPRASVATGV